jgi:hypothetical protein
VDSDTEVSTPGSKLTTKKNKEFRVLDARAGQNFGSKILVDRSFDFLCFI